MSPATPVQLAGALRPPKSLREFSRRFSSEVACEEFLFSVRYPDGFSCPQCGSGKCWPLNGRRLVECPNGHKVSLTAGTVLHRTRQDLVTWFHAAYLVSTLTPGISALQFQRQLGMSRYETAFQMLHRLRSALVAPGREPLHGEVEVDETFIGGKDPDRDGRGGDKVLVAGAVEVLTWSDLRTRKERQRTGRVRLLSVADASGPSLMGFVRGAVEVGALVHTDGWPSYGGLRKAGYDHRPVVQRNNPEAHYVLPHIHRVFSNLKAWLRGTHGGRVEPKYLQAYLNEYAFRFNRRFWRGPAFLRALMLLMEPAARPPTEPNIAPGRRAHRFGAESPTTICSGHRS